MRQVLLTSVAISFMVLVTPGHVRADVPVVCSNCADLVDQLVEKANQAQQLSTQISGYTTQLRQYANMLQNTIALPASIFSQVQSDIMQVRALTQAASLLSGNSGSILSRLQSAQGYANQALYLGGNVPAQFTQWQQTLANADNTLGRALGLQQGQQTNNAAIQAAIQQHSQTAAGQMQAIQAGNELSALTNTQLQQIQATLAAQAQAQATRDIIAGDQQAQRAAEMLQFSHYQSVPTTGSQGF